MSVEAIEMIPPGMLSKAACGPVNFKFRIKVAEYVEMTPLEIEICYVDVSDVDGNNDHRCELLSILHLRKHDLPEW